MARTNMTSREIKNLNQATAATHVAKLLEHDAALDAVCDTTGAEDISAAGAVNPAVYLTTLTIANTVAYTLAAGTKTGQRKCVRVKAVSGSPAGTLTGTFLNGATAATSLAFNAAEDTVQLVWNGAAWCIALAISVSIT